MNRAIDCREKKEIIRTKRQEENVIKEERNDRTWARIVEVAVGKITEETKSIENIFLWEQKYSKTI